MNDPPPLVQWLAAFIAIGLLVLAVLAIGQTQPAVWTPIVNVTTPAWTRWLVGLSLTVLVPLFVLSLRATIRRETEEWTRSQQGGPG